ncbi:MAG: formylglycine-generating enzyme family protein [Blastocatellia bacterium]|nr:formylglycine-generating enzyme family protein [Blastocatellia bacterium]
MPALLLLCMAGCQSLQVTTRRDAIRSLTAEKSFAKIAPGHFLMGSPPGRGGSAAAGLQQESPQHRVSITCGFEIGRYEVTQKQWEAVMISNPSAFKGPELPVTNVSWRDVQEFLARLRMLDARFVYRLPTEAEWEYACRAGGSGPFSDEAVATDLQRVAWHEANSLNRPHAVGHLQPNGWGLYDIHGNVWEWVQDWYDINYYRRSPAENPQGPPSGQSKVQRGGSWQSPAGQCRAAVRGYSLPAERNNLTGFRLARVPRKI